MIPFRTLLMLGSLALGCQRQPTTYWEYARAAPQETQVELNRMVHWDIERVAFYDLIARLQEGTNLRIRAEQVVLSGPVLPPITMADGPKRLGDIVQMMEWNSGYTYRLNGHHKGDGYCLVFEDAHAKR